MAKLTKDLKQIESAGFVFFDEARQDVCYEGKNDFKVRNDYAHRCDVRITRYYGFDGQFQEMAHNLERRIRRLGWSSRTSLDRDLALCYDRYLNTEDRRFVDNIPTHFHHGRCGSGD